MRERTGRHDSGSIANLAWLWVALLLNGASNATAATHHPIVSPIPTGPSVGQLYWQGNLIEGAAYFTADTVAGHLLIEWSVAPASVQVRGRVAPLPILGRTTATPSDHTHSMLATPDEAALGLARRKIDFEESLRLLARRARARGDQLATLGDSTRLQAQRLGVAVDSVRFYPKQAIVWYAGGFAAGEVVMLPPPNGSPQTARPHTTRLAQLGAQARQYCSMLRKGHNLLLSADGGVRYLPVMERGAWLEQLTAIREGRSPRSGAAVDSLALKELLSPSPLPQEDDQ